MQSSYNLATSASPRVGSRKSLPTPAPGPSAASIASNVKGKDLFDTILWKDPVSTSVFYTFIASLRRKIRDEVKASTPTHRFIRTLRDSQRLVRCYTQNIDGLEARDGLCADLEKGKGVRSRFTKKSLALPKVPGRRLPGGDQDGGCEVVQLHGALNVLRCTLCQRTCGWEEGDREALLLGGRAPECLSCTLQDQGRRDRGKRGTKIGTLRPNIVLYGEEHPAADAISSITTHDLGFAPDILLILGTSLHVHGLKILVKEFAKAVHGRTGVKGKVIFVNLTKPSESLWRDVIDYWVAMDCDQWVGGMKRHRPDIWQIQTEFGARTTKADVRPSGSKASAENGREKMEDKENGVSPNAQFKLAAQRPKFMALRTRTPLRDIESASVATGKPCATPSTSPLPKVLKRKRSMYPEQLPTPPTSGHRRRFLDLSKVSVRDDDKLLETPSKRRKPDIRIFQT